LFDSRQPSFIDITYVFDLGHSTSNSHGDLGYSSTIEQLKVSSGGQIDGSAIGFSRYSVNSLAMVQPH